MSGDKVKVDQGYTISEGGLERQKVSGVDRFGLAIVNYISSPSKIRELGVAGVMIGAEQTYDIRKVAREGNQYGAHYSGTTPDNVGPLPENPIVRSVFDSMGDIWEISIGQSIVRIGLHALYQGIGKELMSDDNTFALSLLIPLVLKSAHSLGLISIFGIHDHIGSPVPQMLIGQIVASTALMFAHYSGRRREIRDGLRLVNANDQSDKRISIASEELAINSSEDL